MTARRLLGRVVLYALAVGLLIFILGPFVWLLSASFQTDVALFQQPPNWIPDPFLLDNYRYVFTGEIPGDQGIGAVAAFTQEARRIPRSLGNSLVVALAVLAINLVLATIAAYTFARERFRGRALAFFFILGSRLLPPVTVAIPIYQILRRTELLDTRLGVILVHSSFTLPFSIWVLTLYFRGLPRDIEEASLVDGSGRLRTLFSIAIPLAAPGLAAIAAFSFLFSYNEFLFALLLTQSPESKTIPVAIAAIAQNPDASYSLIAVGVILAIIAPLTLALVFRNYIGRGLVTSLER
jgi:multiple sugar transport system permease protein